jgi:hypothetical protein
VLLQTLKQSARILREHVDAHGKLNLEAARAALTHKVGPWLPFPFPDLYAKLEAADVPPTPMHVFPLLFPCLCLCPRRFLGSCK